MRDRSVNKDIIDEWVDAHFPNAVFKLAEKSGVSARTIYSARAGQAPKRWVTRMALSRALRVSEETLFPQVPGAGVAS